MRYYVLSSENQRIYLTGFGAKKSNNYNDESHGYFWVSCEERLYHVNDVVAITQVEVNYLIDTIVAAIFTVVLFGASQHSYNDLTAMLICMPIGLISSYMLFKRDQKKVSIFNSSYYRCRCKTCIKNEIYDLA